MSRRLPPTYRNWPWDDEQPITATVVITPTETRQFRFLVVDGADKGKHFALPERGLVCVGKSHKHADIVLNDLYVSRVHCELRIEPSEFLET
ncbi:hypothetical protein BH10PLA2_BH10PLA2_22750 [soil metagenome]